MADGTSVTERDADDGARERPLLKMSELAERTGVSAGTIRYYLREGLLGEGQEIVRTSRNMAYYPPEYVQRIALIKRLQEERFMPLRVIREVIAEDPERAARVIELEDRILERAVDVDLAGEPLEQHLHLLGHQGRQRFSEAQRVVDGEAERLLVAARAEARDRLDDLHVVLVVAVAVGRQHADLGEPLEHVAGHAVALLRGAA